MKKLFLFFLCLLTSCSVSVRVEKRLPALPERFEEAPNLAIEPPPDRWWELFGDERLCELVERVLERNRDLRAARYRIKELAARLKEAHGSKFPQVFLALSAEKGETPSPLGSTSYTQYSAGLSVSYELDLWKRLSSAEKAAYYELLAEKERRDALALALVAQVASNYFAAAFSSCQRRLLEEEIETRTLYLEQLKRRYARGLLELSRLLSEEELLEALKRLKLQLERTEKESLRNLSVLLGEYPSARLDFDEGACRRELPPVPAGLPSELLRRRPDVRAAEALLKAAAERVKVARAARFPSLKLTVNGGLVSEELSELVSWEKRMWSVIAGLTQPIFSAGRLKAAEEAARFRLKEAEENYAKVVLEAFKEVENALSAEEKLRKLLQTEKRILKLEKKRLEQVKKRHLRGLSSTPELLLRKAAVISSERRVLEVRLSLFQNRVFLFKALGGGFGEERR